MSNRSDRSILSNNRHKRAAFINTKVLQMNVQTNYWKRKWHSIWNKQKKKRLRRSFVIQTMNRERCRRWWYRADVLPWGALCVETLYASDRRGEARRDEAGGARRGCLFNKQGAGARARRFVSPWREGFLLHWQVGSVDVLRNHTVWKYLCPSNRTSRFVISRPIRRRTWRIKLKAHKSQFVFLLLN